MKEDYGLSIWGDNLWIEEDKAWFVWGLQNVIACVDLKTKKCELLAYIPDKTLSKFRLNPMCMKYRDTLYCMPIYGKSIWAYDIVNHKFDEIAIECPGKELLNARDFWEFENKIYIVSNGLGQIIEINPDENKVENYYNLCEKGDIANSIKIGSTIYSLLEDDNKICQFDLITKEMVIHKIPDVGREFKLFSFDGEKFWLSGCYKEIYVWSYENNEIKTLSGFPDEFGSYNFNKETDGKVVSITDDYNSSLFLHLVSVGNFIWFIPYMTNKIVYVDKEKLAIRTFNIDEEDETKESILKRTNLWYKYLFEYVRDDRYIGLFSIKNNCMLEIDADEGKYEYIQYQFCMSDSFVKDYTEQYANVFNEGDIWNMKVFNRQIQLKNTRILNTNKNTIGADIYKAVTCDSMI